MNVDGHLLIPADSGRVRRYILLADDSIEGGPTAHRPSISHAARLRGRRESPIEEASAVQSRSGCVQARPTWPVAIADAINLQIRPNLGFIVYEFSAAHRQHFNLTHARASLFRSSRSTMQARVEARPQCLTDFGLARRVVKARVFRTVPLTRYVCHCSKPLSVTGRRPSSRGLKLSHAAFRLRANPIVASVSDVVVPVSDRNGETGEIRDLGWARSFSERFELEEEVLGEGSFGVVKPAVLKETGKRYAVKLLPKHVPGEWERYSALLQREVTHWKQLQDCQQVVHLEGVYEVKTHPLQRLSALLSCQMLSVIG